MLQHLILEVYNARQRFVHAVHGVTESQAAFKPDDDSWSLTDNVEHMVWAEMGGINGIWKTANSIRVGKPIWTGDAIHHGRTIEEIIQLTWQPKEKVPEVAKPRWGGPIEYWVLALRNCQPLLEQMGRGLEGLDLERVIYPHIISGPLNVIQRMQFLRFHLDRHKNQIERIKEHPNYPT
jgi:DinB superfamily